MAKYRLKEPKEHHLNFFNFIVAYKREHDGNSPTIREIQEGAGLSSTSMVRYYLDILERFGLISSDEKLSRGIMVVGGEWSYDG